LGSVLDLNLILWYRRMLNSAYSMVVVVVGESHAECAAPGS
jgi:hypothetical protein